MSSGMLRINSDGNQHFLFRFSWGSDELGKNLCGAHNFIIIIYSDYNPSSFFNFSNSSSTFSSRIRRLSSSCMDTYEFVRRWGGTLLPSIVLLDDDEYVLEPVVAVGTGEPGLLSVSRSYDDGGGGGDGDDDDDDE